MTLILMRLSLLLVTAVVSTVVTTTTASPIPKQQDSKILVHIPFQMHDPAGFDHVAADFGFGSLYNDFQSISQYVYYIDETLCFPVTNHSIGHPTLAPGKTWEPPFILLINGGGVCSHVTKVRHGQMIGASAVILSQPTCSCYNVNCTTQFNDDLNNCEKNATIAAALQNDGSAGDISIPSFYIMKQFGELLKTHLRRNEPILMELQWGITDTFMAADASDPEEHKPEIHFWSTAYDPHVRLEVYNDIRTVSNAFSDSIHFVPHFHIFSGERYNCLNTPVNGTNFPCDHLCTNYGRYCSNHATDLSGYAVVKETLRRTCIWDHSVQSGGSNPKHDMFWDYVVYHKKECSKYPSTFADDKCINEAMKVAKIDSKSIDQCMTTSEGVDDDKINNKLQDILDEQYGSGIVSLPSLTFNKRTLHRTSGYLLFEIICNEYWMSNVRTVPDICIKCSSCTNTVGCIENHGKCTDFNNNERYIMPNENTDPAKKKEHHDKEHKKSSSSFFRNVLWILFFGCLFGGAYYYYETQLKDVRRSGSRPLMNDYLHLNVDG